MATKPRIAVDFDGTLFDFAYPAIGPIKPGAKEALKRFRKLGYHIVIYSCRTCKHDVDLFYLPGETEENHMDRLVVQQMVVALDAHRIPYDEIDDGSKGKPYAVWYIDDRGLRFNDNWDQISDYVASHGPA